MRASLTAALLGLLWSVTARAGPADFPTGAPPIYVQPAAKLVAAPGEEIVIRGVVSGDGPATLVLRVDDGRSAGYATRVNEERQLPPGPFTWRVALAGAKTSGGRLLDAADIRRLILFQAAGRGAARIERFGLEAGARLPDGAVGFSFGAPDAPLIAGLSRVSPGDPRIRAGHPVAARRPGLDPVVANGLAEIETFAVDWPKGRARVSLWTEDIGEWENLPRVLRRRIRVNGVDIVDERRTPAQWIAERYLAGRNREASPDDDAWTAYGQNRGGLVSAEVDVGEAGIVIELAGDSATAAFLSAVVVEPAGGSPARDAVEARRRAWMTETFPVMRSPSAEAGLAAIDGAGVSIKPLRVALGRGSGARLSFLLRAPSAVARPEIHVQPPELGGARLGADLYAAQWRLERTGAGANLLERRADFLRGDFGSLPLSSAEPRRYDLWVSAPASTPPGLYEGSVEFALPEGAVHVPVEAEVLSAVLPDAPAPAGFYLDEAPHLTWFEETRADRGRQISCDLEALERLGIRGNAPALSTPADYNLGLFFEDSARAARAGTARPWLAYTPLKRLLGGYPPDQAAALLLAASEGLQSAGLPAPIWSLADEPGNPDQTPDGLAALAASLRASVPGIRLGAQFNAPGDWRFAKLVDTAIVNQGFGIDVAAIERLRALGPDVWLYNTGQPRFTAGLWLWRSGASRYLQWHARMPSADPFDPTDGREGDVQIFPPMPMVCAERPDIHADALEMAEGLVDQRWLAWLDSRSEPAARALSKRLRGEITGDWASASADGAYSARAIRESVIALARGLK